MKKNFVYLLASALLLYSCNSKQHKVASSIDNEVAVKSEPEETPQIAKDNGTVSEIPVYDFAEYKPLLNMEDEKVYVINFWATWCKPCVKELPAFEAIQENYGSKGVKVILTSLDFSASLESHVQPFIKKNHITSMVVLLDDVDSNSWIPKVNKDWSGAIPATLIYNNEKRKFYERSFTYNELETELKIFLQ